MKTDYTYCSTTDCIHRHGCRRYPANYKNFISSNKMSWMSGEECQPNYDDKDCEKSFDLLDRFRNSNEMGGGARARHAINRQKKAKKR